MSQDAAAITACNHQARHVATQVTCLLAVSMNQGHHQSEDGPVQHDFIGCNPGNMVMSMAAINHTMK